MDDYVAHLREKRASFAANVVGYVVNAMHHLGSWLMEQAEKHALNDKAYWNLKGTSDELHRAAGIISGRSSAPNLVAVRPPDAPPWETAEKPKPIDMPPIDATLAMAMAMTTDLEDNKSDTARKKPAMVKQQGQRTTRAVTAQRLVASIVTGQSLDSIDSTPANDYGLGF